MNSETLATVIVGAAGALAAIAVAGGAVVASPAGMPGITGLTTVTPPSAGIKGWLAVIIVTAAFVFSIVVLLTDFGGDNGDTAATATLGSIITAALVLVFRSGKPSG